MPRQGRFLITGVPVHIVQRGRSKNSVFHQPDDFKMYRWALGKAIEKTGCCLHAYVLMDNHIHLLITPAEDGSLARFMQVVGVRYVPYYHSTYGTSGSIWEGRYKSSLVLDSSYFISVMRYIEMNPLRAGMVENAGDYRWSSYMGNIGKWDDRLIYQHELFKALGKNDQERQMEYINLFGLADTTLYNDVIRTRLQKEENLGI
jgi:putative transposase